MHSNPFSAAGYDLRNMESQIERKADKHDVHSVSSEVDRLQHSLREACSQIDQLRSELERATHRIEALEMLTAPNESVAV